MREYKLKLKPQNYTFGVSVGKLLGFIVLRIGIKMDPKKVSAILGIPPTKTLKDLISIQCNIQVVRRLIAQLANINSPFSHLLKKDEKFLWNEKCQKDLENINMYLTNSPIFSPYDSKNILLLYISIALSALGEMLAQKDDKDKERVIYYINENLLDYETRYTTIENMCFTIIFSIKKLRY